MKMYVISCINITLFLLISLKISIYYNNKIGIYVKHNFDAESFYVGNTIRELGEARDNCCQHFFERGEFLRMIDVLCTKLLYCIVMLIVFNTVLPMYEINDKNNLIREIWQW